MTISRAVTAVWRYVRRAPGTFVWLLILTATTYFISHISPEFRDRFLRRRSTNLHELSTDPIRVLITSALYIDGGGMWIYYILYNIFHVPVERRLGTLRWLAVVVAAHVGATYLSEGAVYWEVRHGYLPRSAIFTLDIGVSYALAGVEAVAAYLIAPPWSYVYAGGLILYYGYHLVVGNTFTDLGHFSSMMIGFACFPLTKGVVEKWDPWATWLAVRGRARRTLSARRSGA
ncbi:MAG TPA: rhomboid-like protein [Actinospica sp.]|nr:rhomboid-like protein [Actinospica sp.]